MAKRTVCIQSPAKLSVSHSALVVMKSNQETRIPLEDIWVLILETQQAQITTKALSTLTESGIVTLVCSDSHMPSGLLVPLVANVRQSAIIRDQLLMSRPLQKRLWQRIVKAKIANQSYVLDYFGRDSSQVRKWLSEVRSGDASNRESVAASAYFKALLPSGTRRDGPYAVAFDYGYSVLRAGIARAAVSGGWLVSKGLCHSSELNPFNLVDDLIEPFRPLVDISVIEYDMQGSLNSYSKLLLAKVFEQIVSVNHQRMSVQTAIEIELDTLRQSVLSKDAMQLKLPEVIGLEYVSLGE